MAIYTTFFLCRPEELPGGFPGWRLPLPRPIRPQVKNPFTGEVCAIETREPEWPEEEASALAQDSGVVEIEGDYLDYLEARLPPFVRACPHWAAKSLTDSELSPLAEAVGADGALEQALYSPPSSGAVLLQLPPMMVAKLAALDQRGLEETAKRWAAIMSTPEYTHSLQDGWTGSMALDILREIVALAGQATDEQGMYLLIEA